MAGVVPLELDTGAHDHGALAGQLEVLGGVGGQRVGAEC